MNLKEIPCLEELHKCAIDEILKESSEDVEFKEFILNLLYSFKIENVYYAYLCQPKALQIYRHAFTDKLIDPLNNYEVYEQIGDVIINNFVVNYCHVYREGASQTPLEVSTVARIKIKWVGKMFLSQISQKYLPKKYMNFSEKKEGNLKSMASLYEDIFEAFIGATSFIIDTSFVKFAGWMAACQILEKIYTEFEINLSREELYDGKTRLKEFFDQNKQLGKIEYSFKTDNETKQTEVKIMQIMHGGSFTLLTRVSSNNIVTKGELEKIGANFALRILQYRLSGEESKQKHETNLISALEAAEKNKHEYTICIPIDISHFIMKNARKISEEVVKYFVK